MVDSIQNLESLDKVALNNEYHYIVFFASPFFI